MSKYIFKEIHHIKCKVCGIVKERIKSGVFGDGESPRWVGCHADQWNGKLCPNCNRERARETMRKTRQSRKNGHT